ncbi:MAG: hypothetical protein V1676_00600 [Candidatus Diapherotrites archaeon]
MGENEYEAECEVEIVICNEVLNHLSKRELHDLFLIWFINKYKTKAVVVLEDWNKFIKDWDTKLKQMSPEAKNHFFAVMRSIVTPYREKYANGVTGAEKIKLEGGSIDKLCKIVDRHYATVRYLVVASPANFVGKVRISKEQILTPEELYTRMKLQNSELVKEFEYRYGCA